MVKGYINLKRQCNLLKMNIMKNSTYAQNSNELVYVTQKVVSEIAEEMPKCNCSTGHEHFSRQNGRCWLLDTSFLFGMHNCSYHFKSLLAE